MSGLKRNDYYNRTYPRIDALSKSRLAAGEIHRPDKPETPVQRLSRRIHNQRVQIARIEQFHYGMNHLATIKRMALHSQWYRKLQADHREAIARIDALENQLAALAEKLT
jgi:polyhydroxyalkanoate synthesis regulator phasin